MATKRIIFIRPGETGWNRLGRWQGHVAVPLNDHGQQQAARLARFVRPTGIAALYTSDLRRAADTARILAKMLNIEPTLDNRLRERHIGIWQGLTQDEVIAWYPDEFASLVENPYDNYQIPAGESRVEVAARMKAAFDDIMAQTGDDTIGIVSHTTAIRALLGVLMPEIDALNMPFANMSVTSLAREGETWQITQRNDVTHLEGMPTEVFKELEQKSMILIIDNYDSFTYNIVQEMGELGAEIEVVRNNQITLEAIRRLNPSHIVISPGPGFPKDAGISNDVIRKFGATTPFLGVCLGHQCMGEVYGGVVSHAPQLMHGKTSQIHHKNDPLFAGLPNPFTATRYHSLVVEENTLPDCLSITAYADTGEIMGLRHKEFPVVGVQFHPESILTEGGIRILQNFLENMAIAVQV